MEWDGMKMMMKMKNDGWVVKVVDEKKWNDADCWILVKRNVGGGRCCNLGGEVWVNWSEKEVI